jgi:hypothetical protein
MRREDEINLAYTDYVSTELETDETTYISDAFVAGAKWADYHPHGDWHSVEEKPQMYDDYLVVTKGNTIEFAIFIQEEWHCRDGEVAYWMPLPTKPPRRC